MHDDFTTHLHNLGCRDSNPDPQLGGVSVKRGVNVGIGIGIGIGVYLFLKECCFMVRVDSNPNPNPKKAFFKKKIDPSIGPDPDPNPALLGAGH